MRRQAHGLLKVLVDLPELTGLDRAVTLAQVVDFKGNGGEALAAFLLERLRYLLEQRGFDARNVRAVTHGDVAAISPLTARRKLEVLPEFTSSAAFTQLATAFESAYVISPRSCRPAPACRSVAAQGTGGAGAPP